MFESLVWLLLLALPIVLLILVAKIDFFRRRDWDEVAGGVLCVVIVVVLVINCVHFWDVIERNVTAEERLAEYLREQEDLQRQIDTFSDELALAGVMERAEKYNANLSYAKVAAHSPWNAWSYPARIFDLLEFVEMPEG